MILALGHADKRRVSFGFPNLRRPRVKLSVRVADVNACFKHADVLIRQLAVEPRIIDLADLVLGRNNAVSKLSVRCDDEQSLGVLIQPSRGHRAHRGIHRRKQIHDGFLLSVSCCGQHARRLMEHHMANGLVAQPPPIQPDVIRFPLDLHPRVPGRHAVHRHAPRTHSRFDFAARTLAEQRQQLIQPHFITQISFPSFL